MRRGRRLGVLACALLVVLAGCGAQEVSRPEAATTTTAPDETTDPPATGTTDTPAGDDSRISYRGGSLPFAAAPVFDNVESLLGVTADPPADVSVENASSWFGTNTTDRPRPSGTGRPQREPLRERYHGGPSH